MESGIYINGKFVGGNAESNIKLGYRDNDGNLILDGCKKPISKNETEDTNKSKIDHKIITKEDFLKILEKDGVELISIQDGWFTIEQNENGVQTLYFYSTPNSEFNVPYNK